MAGVGSEAAYVVADGFVFVLTVAPPVLPNGAQVARLPPSGADVVVGADDVWDPAIRVGAADLPADGPDDLVRAVVERDPELAAAGRRAADRASEAGSRRRATTSCAASPPSSPPRPGRRRRGRRGSSALLGGELRRRTTALSATLLELAALGMGPEPLQALLDGDPAALARLEAIGHSTGRAIARGAGVGLLGHAS